MQELASVGLYSFMFGLNTIRLDTYSCVALSLQLRLLFALLEDLGRVSVVGQHLGHPDELALLLSRLHGCYSVFLSKVYKLLLPEVSSQLQKQRRRSAEIKQLYLYD